MWPIAMSGSSPTRPDHPLVQRHDHVPVYRVIRANWRDPLDASYSQTRTDRRWNTPDFPALYACCSETVAAAVARDVFRVGALALEDLRGGRPELVEIRWTGQVVDVATTQGVEAAGFSPDYPGAVGKDLTQRAATQWESEGREGVVYRSASLWRAGCRAWTGPHPPWAELVMFPRRAATRPSLLRRRSDLGWLERADQAQRSASGRMEAIPVPPVYCGWGGRGP